MSINNKSQFLGTREETGRWLDKYRVGNYTINDDLSVDVNGSVDISNKNLKNMLVKFGKVKGDFYCYNNNLISLTGSPKSVDGDFWCQKNHLTSLAGSPKFFGGSFYCYNNPLISLFEITNCDFKQKIYFNIDENNFQQKELIQILKKYYNSERERYELTNHQFQDIIKSQIQKETLQQKLNKPKFKQKTKKVFI